MASNVGLIDTKDVPWYIFVGVIGGMLPDIDADHSKPVKRLFMFLAVLVSTGIWTVFKESWPQDRLLGLVAVAYLTVRYLVFFMFQRLTVHRGVFHSLLGAAFFGLLTTCISHYFLEWDVLRAWLNGVFVVFGCLVHLCLDEIFSVDLANGRMKKSFGTALKLFSYNDLRVSTLLFVSVIALFIAAPSSAHLLQAWKRVEWIKMGAVDLQVLGDYVASIMD